MQKNDAQSVAKAAGKSLQTSPGSPPVYRLEGARWDGVLSADGSIYGSIAQSYERRCSTADCQDQEEGAALFVQSRLDPNGLPQISLAQ